jgi:hypothetical protein
VISAQYGALHALGGDWKLVTMSENGPIPDPDRLQCYEADRSWFCTWSGGFVTAGTHNTLDFLKKAYRSSSAKNLLDAKGWKSGTATAAAPATSTVAKWGSGMSPSLSPLTRRLTPTQWRNRLDRPHNVRQLHHVHGRLAAVLLPVLVSVDTTFGRIAVCECMCTSTI